MSKPKKRTISELVETRAEGRFSSGGFDLLGDGDRLRVSARGDVLEIDIAQKSTPLPHSVGNVTSEKKSESLSIDNFTAAKFASEENDEAGIAESRIVDSRFDVKNKQKPKNAISPSMEKGQITHSSGPRRGVLASRDAFHLAVKQIEYLKAERGSATLVENYIFDTLLAEINNTSASIVYLYLWRRTSNMKTKSIALSMRVLSEAIGISKRTAHEAIKKLNEMELIISSKVSKTGIPEHTLKMPWKNE